MMEAVWTAQEKVMNRCSFETFDFFDRCELQFHKVFISIKMKINTVKEVDSHRTNEQTNRQPFKVYGYR